MDFIIWFVMVSLILLGVGTMIYFGILKTINGNFVARSFVGDEDTEYYEDKET